MAKWSIQLDGDIYRPLEQNPIQSEWNPSKETFLEKTVGGFVILNSPPKNSFKDELSATWSAASLELRNILYDLFYTDKTFKLKTHTGYERNVKIDTDNRSFACEVVIINLLHLEKYFVITLLSGQI